MLWCCGLMPMIQSSEIVIVTPTWAWWAMRTLWSPWGIILIMQWWLWLIIRAMEVWKINYFVLKDDNCV